MNSHAEPVLDGPRGWRRVFACDLRSLAVMRIGLGVLILVDLAMRAGSMQAMYTDAGVLPIDAWLQHWQGVQHSSEPFGWSIHAWNGSLTYQMLLFGLAAVAAVMMLLGWKTRVACVISWILLVSLQMRNPLILHSGDCLFRLGLFWSIFLPVGAVWSLDARRRQAPLNPVVSGATVGLILTLFSLYFFAGIAKLNSVWFSGEAMEYVMRLDIYTTAFGKFLLGYPGFLKLITWGTLLAEIVLPLCMLFPWKNDFWRYLACVTFVGLHLGIASCMAIGLFSPIAIAIWMSVLPTGFWSRWLPATATAGLPAGRTTTATYSTLPRLANTVCLMLAAYFLVWNLATINHSWFKPLMPQSARVVGKWLNMRQTFRMFDVPPKHSPWFVYEAHLKNGAVVDIFRNAPVDHTRPESVLATIPQHHWRRLHRNLARPMFDEYRKPVSEYMVRHWNATHDEDSQILTARTTTYLEEIVPGEEANGLVTQVWYQHGSEIANQQMFDDLLKKVKQKGIILP